MLPAAVLLLAAAAAAQTPGGCGSPPRLSFAELLPKFENMIHFPIGRVVIYACRPGYAKFPGRPHFMKCLAHGQWQEVLEFCLPKKCGHPGELYNGRIAIIDTRLGATVNYTCSEGYRLIGKSQRRCDISGKRVAWSHEPPICQRILCPQPPDVKHGRHNAMYQDDFSYGSAVFYTCERGYPLIGENSIYCTTTDGKNGVWSGPGPRCGGGDPWGSCPFPTVQNGKRISDSKYTYANGDTVVFKCNHGYIMRGQSSIRCNADNSWDPPVPVCEQVFKCSPPPDIANGRHNAQASGNFPIGIAVLYSCKPGYSLIGNAYVQCTEFGAWSRPLPRCTAIGCTTPAVQNGRLTEVKPAYSPRDDVTVECDPGYTLSSLRKAQCQVGGTWDPPVPTCKRVTQCPNPEIRNGRKLEWHDSGYDHGEKVGFECNDGYVLKGSYEIQCQHDGTWDPPAPTCNLVVPCPPPPAIYNGNHDSQGLEAFYTGMIVRYSCDHGYSLFGRGSIHCTESGTWSLPFPRCTNGCGPPPRLKFAVLLEDYATENSFPIGKIVKYSCQPGYRKNPVVPPSVKCLSSGEWTDALDFCKRKSCGHPEEPQNGRVIVLSDLLFGATVSYTCEEGHRLVGQPQRRCQISEKTVAWSGVVPICERIPCLPPPDIEHGSYSPADKDDFSYGSAVVYKCETGYPRTGENSIYCTTRDGQNGEWSGPAPRCGGFPAHSCPIPKISNGRIVRGFKSTYSSGDAVTIACNNGYIRRGQSVIRCQSDNSWHLPMPVCEQVVKCPSPPDIANGKLKGQASDTFVNGTSAFYDCNSGYTLVGKASIQCMASGSWSRPYPRCETVVCPNPVIQNGRKLDRHGSAYTFGQRVRFECNAGYVLNGSHEIQCQQDGSWDPHIPSCSRALPCPPPPPITNARHSTQLPEAFPSGTSVSYSCEPGYALIGKASIRCTASGTWSLPHPTCSKSCGVPPRLSFAELWSHYKTQNGFLVGKTVNYTCLPGYFKVPEKPQTVTCLENQTWSEALEFCKRKSCAQPEDPENGRVIVIDLLFGSSVNYTCNEGYTLVGQLERHCELSGKHVAWHGDAPTCQHIKCPRPPDIQHGNHDGHSRDGFYYASVVTYTCSEVYPLTGEASIHCTTKDGQTGVWSGPAPRCGEVRCPVPQIQNGRSISGLQQVYTYGDTVTFECDPSYTMRGHSRSRCQSDDTWDPPLPVCEQVLPCPPPPPIANARHSAQILEAFPSGTSVKYSCDHGYFLVGGGSIHCMESGTWSLPYPVCSGGCGVPPRLSFAELKNSDEPQDNFPIGTTVTYTCRPGYAKVPEMSLSVTCLDNQMWSAAPESCKRKSCGHPEEPRNGKVIIVTDLLFGSTVNYTCEEGYKLTGMPLRRCEISGRRVAWSGSPPECQRIVCPSPPDIHNGTHNGHSLEDYTYGSYIIYKCDSGHPVNGEDFLHCTTKDGQTGVWSGPAPRCGEVRCPVPQIQNGRVLSIQQVYTYGDLVTFACDPSFTMRGHRQSQCQLDDTWDPPVPVCEQEVQCLPAPTITNGKHNRQAAEAFTSGMSIRYQCDPGYTLIGEAQLHCTASGAWSHPAPRCEEPKCPPPPSIANGKPGGQASDTFNSGSVFLYSCKPGYTLVGAATIHCMESGAWSRPLPRCTVVGCKNLFVDNGRIMGFQNIYRPGDIIVVACDHGYVPTSTPESQCQFGGKWDPPIANCKKVLECPPPPNIANAERSHQALEVFTPGMSVEYFCDAEYSLIGERSISCTTAGTWSLPLPLCEVIRCTDPKIQNGRKLDSRGPFYKPWDVVMLECSAGYSLSGSYEIQCGEDGAWDPPVPTCSRAGCEIPKLHNGRILGLKLVYDPRDSVTVECDLGYMVKGTHVSQCQDDGTWDPPVAVCEKVPQCPLPPNITHAEHSSREVETFTPGLSVNYSCELGYSLVGEGSIYCTTSGVWSLPLPRCEAVTCPNPEILNGRNLADSTPTYSVGDSVRLECSTGYRLNGSHEIVCGEDGAWHPPVPVCNQVTCGSPKVQNGKATGTKPVHSPRDAVTVECDAGYAVNGSLESRCQDDGTWDPPVLLCERAPRCPLPPNITRAEHSSREVETFIRGMSVNYTCEQGYSLVGEGSIYCTTSGVWSLPLPRCEAVTCPNPEILNGRNLADSTPTYSVGDSVRLECSTGYRLNGSHEIVCGEDGAWHPPVPVCNQVTCGSPKVQNGKATGTKPVHSPRDAVTVECDAGYAVNGSLESRCQDDGTWDPPVLLCERVVFCTNPEIPNGRKLAANGLVYRPGDRMQFECSAGYSLNGSHEIQCGKDGVWDPPFPACIQELPCSPPPAIANGKHSGQALEVFPSGMSVHYSCDPGYSLVGEASIHCTESGNWSLHFPLCAGGHDIPPRLSFAELRNKSKTQNGFPVGTTVKYTCHTPRNTSSHPLTYFKKSGCGKSCSYPEEPENGTVVITDLLIGSTVNYSCEEGYRLIGEAQRHCEISDMDVAWSGTAPICEPVICTTPEIPNGRQLDGRGARYLPGHSVSFECNADYVLNGSREIQCQQDGNWDPPIPVCNQVLLCPPPPAVANGMHNAQALETFPSGMSVNYSCEPGYSLRGEASIHCTESGNWSFPYPLCAEVSVAGCGAPRAQNGRISGLKHVYDPGDIVTVECEPDYTVNGTQQSRCQGDGTWDPPVLVCERVLQCPLPPSISNGKLSSHASAVFTPGMSASYSCDPGYTVTGEASISCTESGRWSLPIPQCKGKSCSYPEEPENGTVVITDLLIGSTVNYSCEEGYRLIGEAQRHCEISDMDVAWSGTAPICEPVICTTPEIPNGRQLDGRGARYLPGHSVSFECNADYVLNGSREIQCQQDGNWDPPIPVCNQVLLCPPPPAVANGMHNAQALETFPSGMSVNYSCEPGYSLRGEASIHCTESGNWSFPYPLCAEVSVAGCGAPRAQNGRISGLKHVYDPGDIVTVECEPDYTVNGTQQSRCQGDGTWDPPVLVCERVLQCPLPPSISNGKLSSHASAVFTPGMSASYSCDPGYTVTGEASISCTESGRWSLPIPQCKGGHGVPPRLSFAELRNKSKTQNGFPVGTTVKYTCHTPRNTSSHPLTYFKKSGCGKSCSYPEEPENGTVVITDLLIGSTVNYSCEEGYRLIGEAQRHCEISDMDVAWSGTAPICEPVICTTPEIPNGRQLDGRGARYLPGHSVSFECNADYVLNGSREIQCQQDGNWDPPIPVCNQVLLCPPPPAVANGMHNAQALETFPSGMSVNYSCEPGYSLRGEASIHCTESGNWSFPYPLCAEVSVAGCGAPRAQNGRISGLKHVYDPGDIVTVECEPDYTVNGTQQSRCQGDGTWDPPVLVCERAVTCTTPEIPNGRNLDGRGPVYRPGDRVRVECNDIFTLNGSQEIWCMENGTWHPPIPYCSLDQPDDSLPPMKFILKHQCPSPPTITNGKHSGQDLEVFTPGVSVNYSCEPGFSLAGETSISCTASGTWNQPFPSCKGCAAPPAIANGNHSNQDLKEFAYGSSVTHSCDMGYLLIGEATSQCTSSGTWVPPLPYCKEIRCVVPDVPGIGKAMMGMTYPIGTNLTMQCDDGYMLEGSSLIQCQDDLSWDPPMPVCKSGSYSAISAVTGVSGAMLLVLLVMGIVWRVASKKKAGYYHTYENYDYPIPMTDITDQKSSFAP